MAEAISTGIFIPENKRLIFTLAFEKTLISLYNCNLLFGPLKKNSCEVKLKYTKSKRSNGLLARLNILKAKGFINQHVEDVLYRNIFKKKNPKVTSTITRTINLDEENLLHKPHNNTIDLTGTEAETIVLDETIIDLDRTISQLDLTIDRIVTEENDIQIINVKKKRNALCDSVSVFKNGHDNEVQILGGSSKRRKIKENTRRNKVNKVNEDIAGVHNNDIQIIRSSKSKENKKRQKVNKITDCNIVDVQNNDIQIIRTVPLTSTCIKPSHPKLSECVQTYYNNLNTVVSNTKKMQKTYSCSSLHSISNNILKKNRTSLKKKKKNIEKRKSKGLKKLVLNQSPCVSINRKTSPSESNIFNPNPLVVDIDGLRPIVIDGCNVACGHGKGRFSVKGIKICVDYFHIRGHSVIKVILPMCRQKYFPADFLSELECKCHVVFTPSILVDGIRKTPYDDRYIVQYADEFGGVIVSTDNYRDLLKENPKWRSTILNRLLMFTWVDDFLMFPVDPLGRKGPTLNEFLRF